MSLLAVVLGFLAFLAIPVFNVLIAMALLTIYETACDPGEPAKKKAPPRRRVRGRRYQRAQKKQRDLLSV